MKPRYAAKSIEHALSLIDDSYISEFKYDGSRLLIHWNKPTVELITASKKKTDMFPELISNLQEYFSLTSCNSCVLDSELVPYNKITNHIMTADDIGKKHVYVSPVIFDVLEYNSVDLTCKTLYDRKQLLGKYFKTDGSLNITVIMYDVNPPIDTLTMLLHQAVDRKTEGLVLKSLSGTYVDGRSTNWVKVKYFNCGIGDTLDLVIVGGYCHGDECKDFLVAYKDYDNANLVIIGRVGYHKGISTDNFNKVDTRPLHYITYKKVNCNIFGSGNIIDMPFTEHQAINELIKSKYANQCRSSKYLTVQLNKYVYYPDWWCAPTVIVEVSYMSINNNGPQPTLRDPKIVKVRKDKICPNNIDYIRKLV